MNNFGVVLRRLGTLPDTMTGSLPTRRWAGVPIAHPSKVTLIDREPPRRAARRGNGNLMRGGFGDRRLSEAYRRSVEYCYPVLALMRSNFQINSWRLHHPAYGPPYRRNSCNSHARDYARFLPKDLLDWNHNSILQRERWSSLYVCRWCGQFSSARSC